MLVGEALDHFPPEQPLAVTCDPRDVAAISAMVRAANRTVTVEGALDCRGGLVVADASGRVIVDNTLERRIERAREVLWSAVAAAQADCLHRAASAQRAPALS
jgi:vacuolar-type H+-ATPase subunit E/Vma4